MVVLKKINASTLVETITASVILIIVFTLASLTLNNVFSSEINNDTSQIENYIQKKEYQYINKSISIPYKQDIDNWELSIFKMQENNVNWIVFKADNIKTKKSVVKRLIDAEK